MIQPHASTSGRSADTQAEYPSGLHRCEVECVRWGEVECVGGEVECVGQGGDPRLRMGARLDEALWWKSNRPGWSLDDCCHVTSALGTLRFEGHVITIASFFGRKLRWAWNCWREMRTWWKTSQPNEGDWERKLGDHWKHPSPVGKLMSLKKSCCWWKTFQPDDGKTGEENQIRDQSMKKPSNLDWGQEKKNRDWWWEEGFVQGGTWMIRNLVRIRCYVVLQELNYYSQLPYRLLGAPRARKTDPRLPAGFWLCELHWLGFLLVASFLSLLGASSAS